MGKLSDEIMSDLRKKKSGGEESLDVTEEDASGEAGDDTEAEYAGDEVAAMQDFEDATTPKEKASALRAFLEACGVATK